MIIAVKSVCKTYVSVGSVYLNISVMEVCAGVSRKKRGVTPSNKYVYKPLARGYSITQRQIYGFNFS